MLGSANLTVLNAAAARLPAALSLAERGHRLIVAGNDPIGMSLAQLALPSAARVWANLSRSKDILCLRERVSGVGGCDGLLLAVQDHAASGVHDVLQTVIAFLPDLRERSSARVDLYAPDGPAKDALRGFASRLSADPAAGCVSISVRSYSRQERLGAQL